MLHRIMYCIFGYLPEATVANGTLVQRDWQRLPGISRLSDIARLYKC